MPIFANMGRSRVCGRALARDLSARCGRNCFFGRHIIHRVTGNVAKWYFPKWYLRAPLIHVNRRCSGFRSLFKSDYDEIIRALDIFLTPDLAIL